MKRAISYITLLLALLAASSSTAQTRAVSGSVSGYWDADTIKVYGDLNVPEDSVLLIDPGTVVVFFGHYRVTVRGTVLATGTPEEKIRFMVCDTTGFTDTLSTAGGWHGFFYDHMPLSADTSLFRYCIFENGKAVSTDTTGLYGGTFRIFNFGKVAFHHCRFENNLAYRWGGAIYAKYADITVMNCELVNNRCGKATLPYGYGGALCFVHSAPVVMNNFFGQNSSTGIGGGASFEYSDAVVRFNIFYQNQSGLGGAIGYMRSSPANKVSNNLFDGNSAVYFGGAIACIRSYPDFVNNTVVNNLGMYGGAFYANDSAAPSNHNTIFYNNWGGVGNEVYIFDAKSTVNFYYCNLPGGIDAIQGSGGQQGYHGEFVNNYDTVPEFAGTGLYPYELFPGSPMIDAGTPDTTGLFIPAKDLAGNDRIWNNRIDPGAFEWYPGVGIRMPEMGLQIRVFPNPCSESTTITFPIDQSDHLTIEITDMKGTVVKNLKNVQYLPGMVLLTWDLTSDSDQRVGPGVYVCSVSGKTWKKATLIEVIR